MAIELSKDDLRRFARLGAIKRLDDIRREEASIRASFPELFAGDRPARAGKPATGSRTRSTRAAKGDAASGEAAATPARKRSTMSPAMRKVVSARMKKYWAGRRKAKNG